MSKLVYTVTRRDFGRLALVLVSLALALYLGEMFCRILAPPPATIRFRQRQDNSERIGRPNIASVIENDPELFWRLIPNQRRPADGRWARGVISNDQSLREDHQISFSKADDEIRLLFLGDSCTFGSGLLHHESFVEKVEVLLRARFPKSHIECINAGVPGYSLFQGWRFLETKGLRFQPDLVVLTFGWNDSSKWDGFGDWEHYEALKVSQPIAALRWSRLCQLLWRTFHSTRSTKPASTGRTRLTRDEFGKLLAKIHRLTDQHDTALLLLIWPGRFNVESEQPPQTRTPLQQELFRFGSDEMEFGPSRSSGVVDLVSVVQQMAETHETAEIFLDHVHATSLTNQEIANAIVDKIKPWIEVRCKN